MLLNLLLLVLVSGESIIPNVPLLHLGVWFVSVCWKGIMTF